MVTSFPSLRLGFWEILACFNNQHRKVIVVINIPYVKIVLCTFIGRTQFFLSEQWANRLSRFQEELIITNKTEYLSIAIDPIVAKHFLSKYITSF